MQRLCASPARLVVVVAALAAAAALTLAQPARALTITIGGGEFVTGSGKMVDVVRPVGAFSALRMDGSIDVTAHPGSTASVSVHADDNLEPLIETAVEGDTLVVRLRKGVSYTSHGKLAVDVTFARLAATHQHGSGNLHVVSVSGGRLESSIAGSGDLKVDDAKLDSFSLSIAGSGDATIAGHADEARIAIAGSGDVDAARFAVRRMSASISGSGDARVNASESLVAHVAGSGDVTYSGHPHDVSRHVSGSGSVSAAD